MPKKSTNTGESRAYRYRIYPNAVQIELLNEWLSGARYVFNRALGICFNTYEAADTVCRQTYEGEDDGYQVYRRKWLKENPDVPEVRARIYPKLESFTCRQGDQPGLLTQWKHEQAWLYNVPSYALQASLQGLDKAFNGYLAGRAGKPRFKSRFNADQSVQVFRCRLDEPARRIYLNRDTAVKIGLSDRRLPVGEIKTVTVTRTASGRWYASILCDTKISLPEPMAPDRNKAIGVHFGLRKFCTDSTGDQVEAFTPYADDLAKVRRGSRMLSRKRNKRKAVSKKPSKKYVKLKQSLAMRHAKIANKRSRHTHGVSREIVDAEATTICMEQWAIKGMMESARSDGRLRVLKIARRFSDAGIAMTQTQVEYKARRAGKPVLKAARGSATTGTCAKCRVRQEVKFYEHVWTCTQCGSENDREHNAAANVIQECFATK